MPTAGADAGEESTADALGDSPKYAPTQIPSLTALALVDLIRDARTHHLWHLLGWQDIRQRYRRSILGPLRLTLSMGALVAALGFRYGMLIKVEVAVFVPHLALGFIVWTLISSTANEGCKVFIDAEGIISR